MAKVKDGSKIVLEEDVVSRERRCLELLRNANEEKSSKSLAEINLEVDMLAGQLEMEDGDEIIQCCTKPEVLSSDNPKYRYNAATRNYEDLMAAGIIDPTKCNQSFRCSNE